MTKETKVNYSVKSKSDFKIVLVNRTENTLPKALGMDLMVANNLQTLIDLEIEKQEKDQKFGSSLIIETVSPFCKTKEELTFVVHTAATWFQSKVMSHIMMDKILDPLSEFISTIKEDLKSN